MDFVQFLLEMVILVEDSNRCCNVEIEEDGRLKEEELLELCFKTIRRY